MATASKTSTPAPKASAPVTKAPAATNYGALNSVQQTGINAANTRVQQNTANAADRAAVAAATTGGFKFTYGAPAAPVNKIMPTGDIQAPTSAIDNVWNNYTPETPAERATREAALQTEELQRQQNEIAGIDVMYQNLFKGVNQDAAKNNAMTEYVNGMSGLGGSNVGVSNMVNTEGQNAQAAQKVTDARNQEVQSVVDNHRKFLADQINQDRTLRQNDYTAWANYQSGKETRAKSSVNTVMTSLLAKYKPEQIDPKYFEQLSKGTGMSPQELQAAYAGLYDNKVASDKAAALEALKTNSEINKNNATATETANAQMKQYTDKGYVQVTTPALEAHYAKLGYPITTVTINGVPTKMAVTNDYATEQKISHAYDKKAGTPSATGIEGVGASDLAAINADMAKIRGADGYYDSAKIQDVRQNVSIQNPKALAWFDKTYPVADVTNPDDPRAANYHKAPASSIIPTIGGFSLYGGTTK